MSAVPALPALPSLLSPDRHAQLTALTDGLDGDGLWWLSGFAAGLARARQLPTIGTVAAPQPGLQVEPHVAPHLTIVYGSQTGNAKRLAGQLAQQLEAAGIPSRLLRADAYPIRELKAERYFAIVISTQGDGDPPDDARGLVDFILGKRAPSLTGLHYAVLGLGDSSYPQFCAIGHALDGRLAELGATRWIPRADADLDIDTVAAPWLAALTSATQALRPQAPSATVTPLRPPMSPPQHHGREHPFAAELLVNQRISGRDSDQDIRHLELSLDGSGLRYAPGDALGVWPQNPPLLVAAVLDTLALDGERAVNLDGHALPLREWLGHRRELTRLSRPFLLRHAQRAGNAALDALLAPDNGTALSGFLGEHQMIDLLRAHPAVWSHDELVASLRPLTPRLYSIASSHQQVGDEVHLTVAHVRYDRAGDTRWGAASDFLVRAAEGERLPVFIEHNERFRLPADASRDIVMIGPGTGVAPFRGFVQERAATGASGRNWLLFGHRHARSDFLYQVEWQDALQRGQLQRLDLAFSRDQTHKLYVQDRLREHGRELYAWLQDGAHLYVCGDATRMAKDVHAALLDVITKHGGKSADDANDYLNDLQMQGRYARDVY